MVFAPLSLIIDAAAVAFCSDGDAREPCAREQ